MSIALAEVGALPADCPISSVITVSEVITLPIDPRFHERVVAESSKGVPVILSRLARTRAH